MAKNLYSIGKYQEAALQFSNVGKSNFLKLNDIKFAALINAAIVYHKLNDIEKFRESLQGVIIADMDGKYKKIALDILSQQ
jgi:transcriptional regulator NrdR family protein